MLQRYRWKMREHPFKIKVTYNWKIKEQLQEGEKGYYNRENTPTIRSASVSKVGQKRRSK